MTGVSVRTLHHYHAIGLLCPSARAENGYRLYDANDVVRLQQIKSLRFLGFSLEEVRQCLDRRVFTGQHIIEMNLHRVRQQIEKGRHLCAQLEAVRAQLESRQPVSTQDFVRIVEAITMTEKYFDAEQMAFLEERKRAVGEDRIREVEAQWPRLMAEVQTAIDNGTDPASEEAQSLAKRWMGLVSEFTGGNPSVQSSLSRMYEQEPNVAGNEREKMRPLFDFITRAQQATKS
ncbi:nodulation protein NolA [Abditibacteriota bacterium]|nr:nodulation protein NolA [Abditibacteriota bacterium]